MPERCIRYTELPGGARWELPMRPLGKFRLLAILPSFFAMVPIAVLLYFMLGPSFVMGVPFLEAILMAVIMLLCMGIFLLPFFAVWYGFLFIILSSIVGHMRIEVTGRQFAAFYCLGPLRWRRRREGKPSSLKIGFSSQ